MVVVHPEAEGEGTGTVLRRWAEARASERGTSVLRQFAYGANDRARRLLREAGYEPAQHYFRLRADLAEVPGPADVPLREFEPGDEAAVHRLIEDAFTEIDGHTPMTVEEWRAKGIAKAGHDPSAVAAGRGRATGSPAPRSASAGRTPRATSPSWPWPRGRAGAASGARSCSACSPRSAAPGSRTPS